MLSTLHRLARSTLAAILCCGAANVCAQTTPLAPLEAFFGRAPISHPALSPNGKLLAVIVAGPSKRDELAVIDLADSHVYRTAHFDNLDVGRVRWVNDERLVFNSADQRVGQRDIEYGPGLYAINYDGGKFKQLAYKDAKFVVEGSSKIVSHMLPYHTYLMDQDGAQDSDLIYVESAVWDATGTLIQMELLQLDTVTGKSKPVNGPGRVRQWVLDKEGQPRLAVVLEGPVLVFYYREPGTGAWRKVASQSAYTAGSEAIAPLAFGAEGKLYVTSAKGADTTGVYEMDLATGTLGAEPLISAPGYDFDGELVFSKNKLAGFQLRTDARATMWFDPALNAVQQTVDKQLPGLVNLVTVPSRPQSPWVLVESYADVQPTVLHVYNADSKTLRRIGASHPQILASQMGRQEVLRYKARDGLQIPALLTLPPGGKRKNLPLVMLVHGGPWVRGASWGWDAQAHFLASRGYAVLQPEFRGSTGFGSAHFAAGWKQWGLAMQNDIADGAKWAIAQGIADPGRICIAGASYGGYAAMMGMVNDPDLYQCAVNWVGVTDIELMYADSWGTVNDSTFEWRAYGMPQLVGDQVKDAAQLKATSPLQQATRIKKPLLLAYGGADRRVPPIHGEKFYSAVRQGNPNVEWVLYQAEGHGWYLPETQMDFWNRVEKFLGRNIGPRP